MEKEYNKAANIPIAIAINITWFLLPENLNP